MSDEQIAALAECLNRHGVAYVIVGGAASQLHGAPVARTRDADVVPARDAMLGIPIGIALGRLAFARFAQSLAVVNHASTPAAMLAALIVAVLLAAVIADLFAVVVARRTHTAAVLREG